jgi:tetratricopeptide (TPR) repeat protein
MPQTGNILFQSIAMKTPFVFILSCLLITGRLWAQPGGGGGLNIGSFYNSKLDSIPILTDPSLKIRSFLLKEGDIVHETFLFQTLLKEKSLKWYRSGFTLPPYGNDYSGSSSQRMYIIYRKDTMIIDFIDITSSNGVGYIDGIDSLVIQKGYYTYFLHGKKDSVYRDVNQDGYLFFYNGVTPTTVNLLTKRRWLVYTPYIDLTFLKEENLPASFYFKRAGWYLKNGQPQLALPDIEKGTKKNKDTANQEGVWLLYDAYVKTRQYDKALHLVSKAINDNQGAPAEKRADQLNHYKTRIDLFIQLKKYTNALDDYDRLVALSTEKEGVILERAYFEVRYLHEYKSVMNELRATINAIPPNHLNDRPQGRSEYCELYFLLGIAEYKAEEKAAAWKHWLKAEEFGYGQTSSDYAVVHFDSIIKKNAKVPEIYLARALAHENRGLYSGGGADTNSEYELALADINTAERLGMQDYRINMYRASVLNQLKRYQEAMKDIDAAIAQIDTDPRCYSIRFDIRNNLGQIRSGGEMDVDIKRYQNLLPSWNWDDY